jgi:capsid protein
MARAVATAKRAPGIPAPQRVVPGPAGPVPAALRGRGARVMTVADLVSRRWDAGVTSNANRDKWRGATGADVNSDIQLDRETVLARARHEAKNNPNVVGARLISGAHTVGKHGPTLQVLTTSKGFAKKAEAEVRAWFEHAGADGRHFVDHLLEAVRALPETGEILWQIVTDPKARTVVKSRVHPLNPKYLKTPHGKPDSTTLRLGVERDTYLRPTFYHYEEVVDGVGPTGRFLKIAAKDVIHWYRRDEVGQARGMAQIGSSLETAADLRAYEKAVQEAMDAAALFGVILYSDDPKARTIVLQGETEITPKTMAAIPPGYKAAQIAPTHPTQNHEAWKKSKLQQILLPLGMPMVVGTMDSQDTSYSGGRIDLQNYGAVTGVTQGEIERAILDRCVSLVLREAHLAGALPASPEDLEWQWVWPAIPHVDPVKHATAQRMRRQDGTIDDSTAAAEYGLDSATLIESRQREQMEADQRLLDRIAAMQKYAKKLRQADPELEIPWPLLLAASGAQTAPGAFLQGAAATGAGQSQADAEQPEQDEDDAEPEEVAAEQERSAEKRRARRKHGR